MIPLILLLSLIFIIGKLQASITFSHLASSRYIAFLISLLAWGIVMLLGLSVWDIVKTVAEISVFSVLKLAAVLIAGAFIYQYLITVSEPGSLDILLRQFFSMLMFRVEQRKTDDIFIELEKMNIQRAMEEGKKKSSDQANSSDEEYKKYFGS